MSNNNDFQFSASTCGFKRTKKPDLAVVYSSIPCTYAGVFTKNQVRAACVDENKALLKQKKQIKAIVVNSGNANACTGKEGVRAVKKTQAIAAGLLNIKSNEVLVASTGIIGVLLDVDKIRLGLEDAIPKLSTSDKSLRDSAKAILTTDRYEKIVIKKHKSFKLVGFTKGAGMIHPDMATMLCFFFTNLAMPQKLLQAALKEAVDDTFNVISVDGDMSTNDMVILLSNNNSDKQIQTIQDPLYIEFQKTLHEACNQLAKEIVIDGEGANTLINIKIIGAKNNKDAREIARSISTSTLFKCAVFGSDPNWGRAVARVGATSVKINQDKLDVFFNNVKVLKNGNPISFDKQKLYKQIKKSKEVNVRVDLKLGKAFASAAGCDLSLDYVKFNSGYFT